MRKCIFRSARTPSPLPSQGAAPRGGHRVRAPRREARGGAGPLRVQPLGAARRRPHLLARSSGLANNLRFRRLFLSHIAYYMPTIFLTQSSKDLSNSNFFLTLF